MTVRDCLAELGFVSGIPGGTGDYWDHPSGVTVFLSVIGMPTNVTVGDVHFPGCRRVFDLLHLLQLLGAKVPGSLDQFTENTTVDEAMVIMDQHKRWWLDLGNLPLCEKGV